MEAEPNKNLDSFKNDLDALKKSADQHYQTIQDSLKIKEENLTRQFDEIKKIHEDAIKSQAILNSLNDQIQSAQSITAEVEKTQTETQTTLSKAEALYKNMRLQMDEFEKIYHKVFGYTEGEGTNQKKIPGLEERLQNAYVQLSNDIESLSENLDEIKESFEISFKKIEEEKLKNLHDEWKKNYSALDLQIKSLLPNALTAGLSHAYEEKRKQETIERDSYQLKFNICIAIMSFFALLPIGVGYYEFLTGKQFDQIVASLPTIVSIILPLYIPTLWLAYFSNKQVNLSKRLVEEYSHKEVLSKTFEGLSTQISVIEKTEVVDELKTKLLYNILEVSSENPGKLITDYNKSDHPLMDALDKSVKLTLAVEKLSRIPGFNKIANRLAQNAQSIQNGQTQKAEAGLDTINRA